MPLPDPQHQRLTRSKKPRMSFPDNSKTPVELIFSRVSEEPIFYLITFQVVDDSSRSER